MTGKPFTFEQVLEATRAIVDERGHDFIYQQVVRYHEPLGREIPQCVYADDEGQPSCLVGHVIHRLDPEAFETLARRERSEGGDIADSLRLRGHLPQDFWTDDAEAAMVYAQDVQDSGDTWSEALHAAENLAADAD